MVFYDYLWHPADYRQAFEKAGLEIAEERQPIGNPKDPEHYVNEHRAPFWHIYVLEPKKLTKTV
ncbi:MAG: hypothetical protein HY917_03320 [Candidatus Diapherotrites archaeon]|nr:hypothetical protein [Candidatus Diapherotrites archaeon]